MTTTDNPLHAETFAILTGSALASGLNPTLEAWAVRDAAHVHGPTKVGCAVVAESGTIYSGCNVEHRYRSHDVHAEVNALTTMAAADDGPALLVVIAAERAKFTPCGACLDWIFELGRPDTLVVFSPPEGDAQLHLARDLMPHYPC